MFDSVDSPVAYINGWNKGFEDGIDFFKTHLIEQLRSEEFTTTLSEKGIDLSAIGLIVSLIGKEE
jgi:hypothetical protein